MKAIAITCLAAMLLAFPLSAGVVFEIDTTDHDSSPPRAESTQASAEGKNLKMEVPPSDRGGRGGTVLFRGDRHEMVVVDHDQKSYMVIDQETMRKIGEQASAANAQIAEALKNIPEEQRAAVEKMMKERMPQQERTRPTIDVRKTGERGTKNGYPCVKYEVLRDGRKMRELWVTDWNQIEGGSEVAGAFREMAELMKKMRDAIPATGAPGGFDDAIMLQMNELPGFPVVTRDFDETGSLESESSLRSSRRQSLDPDEFEPPAGYKRRSMFGG